VAPPLQRDRQRVDALRHRRGGQAAQDETVRAVAAVRAGEFAADAGRERQQGDGEHHDRGEDRHGRSCYTRRQGSVPG